MLLIVIFLLFAGGDAQLIFITHIMLTIFLQLLNVVV
jgi:hypothetical protein